MNVKAKGYVLGIVAAATYGMNPLCALPLYKAGMNPDSVLFFQVFVRHSGVGGDDKIAGKGFQAETEGDLAVNYHGATGGPLVTYLVPEL